MEMAGPVTVTAFWLKGEGFSVHLNVRKVFYLKLIYIKKKRAVLVPERGKCYPARLSRGNSTTGKLGSCSEESCVASSSG